MTYKDIDFNQKTTIDARIASLLVKTACRFNCQLMIENQSARINIKSMMGVVSLGNTHPQTLTIIANGDDEKEAMVAISSLIEKEFLVRPAPTVSNTPKKPDPFFR